MFDLPYFGNQLFQSLGHAMAVIIPGLALLSASGAILMERRQNTLAPLLLSHLSSWGVVWGKFGALSADLLTLMLGTVPFYAFIVLLGGVEPHRIAKVLLLVFATALFASAAGILFSALSNNQLLGVAGAA